MALVQTSSVSFVYLKFWLLLDSLRCLMCTCYVFQRSFYLHVCRVFFVWICVFCLLVSISICDTLIFVFFIWNYILILFYKSWQRLWFENGDFFLRKVISEYFKSVKVKYACEIETHILVSNLLLYMWE